MVRSRSVVLLLALLLLPLQAGGQEPEGVDSRVAAALQMADELKPEAEAMAASNDRDGVTAAEFRAMQEKHKIYLLLGLLVVTPIFLFLELCYIKNTAHTAENVVNGTGLVLIIQATLLVVIASPTTEQLTAAIGVLGAIAGYLFGSTRRQSEGRKKGEEGEERSSPSSSSAP